jgi:pimeloyl-ACP methyl ester carboxylesterase
MMEMSSTIAGRRLAYWCSTGAGAGETGGSHTLLLLHGLGADHEGLLPLARAWPGAHIVAPDLPGFGRSDPLAATHSLVHYADAMEALCADLGLSDVTVLGHSLGASIALTMSARYPRRARALVLISPVAPQPGRQTWLARAYYEFGSRLPTWAARRWFLSRPAVYVSDRLMFVTADRRVRRRILDADYRSAALASPRAITEVYRSIREMPLMTVADGVRTPAVLIGSEHDSLAPPAALAALSDRIPHSELSVLPGAGHLWCVEEPADAARLISASLERLTGSPVADGRDSTM